MASSHRMSGIEQLIMFLLIVIFLPILFPLACMGRFMGWTDIKNK